MAQENIESEMNFGQFKSFLGGELDSRDCESLCVYFNLRKAAKDYVMNASSPGLQLLEVLTETGVIVESDVTKLEVALKKLRLGKAAQIAMSYQETSDKDNGKEDEFDLLALYCYRI